MRFTQNTFSAHDTRMIARVTREHLSKQGTGVIRGKSRYRAPVWASPSVAATAVEPFQIYQHDWELTGGPNDPGPSSGNQGTVTGATNTAPISITAGASHGLTTGDKIKISSVLGNTAANGEWIITVTGASSFILNSSTGNGAYTSGGTWSKAYWRTFRVKRGFIISGGTASNDDQSTDQISTYPAYPDPGQFVVPAFDPPGALPATFFWLEIATSGKAFASAKIVTSTNALWPGNPAVFTVSPHKTYVLLGSVTTDEEFSQIYTINQYWTGDVFFIPQDGLHNFQLYPLEQSPSDPETDWRYVTIHSGTVNGTHPDNDDTAGSPLEVLVPESAALKFWLKLTINTTTGAITAITIDHDPDGWQLADGDLTDYPAQPVPAANVFPAQYYIMIAEISTSDDATHYLSVNQTTETALGAGAYEVGTACNAGVIETTWKFGHWRA